MAADHHSSSRRSLLKGAAGYAAVSFVGTLQAFQSRQAYAAESTTPVIGPFGPIAPVNDITTGLPLLQLPSGFQYASLARTGDPMSNGEPGSLERGGKLQAAKVKGQTNTSLLTPPSVLAARFSCAKTAVA